jgi:hypothetical protein
MEVIAERLGGAESCHVLSLERVGARRLVSGERVVEQPSPSVGATTDLVVWVRPKTFGTRKVLR